ncbi:MAG: bifunctional UDP-N-acetylglucosamine pyrophosphorylase / Glucosamine-phosphate N-acetyltransferase [Candidatus Peribacteria bacterium]|nr:bifunctional UDP-N-acetylglucosamine pyrophosphorylase / Glucosamine-phosphate N-acetyltransferase [Candidatus Peribacteria bacterium]
MISMATVSAVASFQGLFSCMLCWMKVLLLVAGRSRRFWPLSEKSLFPVCGKPLIGHQIARLREAGLTDITLIGGDHNLDDIHALYPDLPVIRQENLDLGMQGALLSALPSCKSEPVLIVSANDVIESFAYEELAKEAQKKNVDGVLLARKMKTYFTGGYLNVDGNRITGIVEKPGEGNEPSDLVNIVAHIHNDASILLAELNKTTSNKDDAYEVALASLFARHTYHAVPYTGDWQAVKYGWHLLHLLPLLLKDLTKADIHSSAVIHKTAVVEGNVILEEGVRILPHACVIGPAYIGRGTIVGNNALVRGASIGKHCVVGYNTEVKGSVLADHVWTHSTYLGDSVIGENVSFGAGCVTGNFRLDEHEIHSADISGDGQLPTGLTKFGALIGDGCRVGIQVGMNPGVKIGKDSFIAGGLMLTEDVPDASFVRLKDGKNVATPNKTKAPHPKEREKYAKNI